MRYNEQIALKLYTYTNNTFTLQAIIDDYQEISFAHNLYEAGDFTITINYNIPNALKFERGMFIQFGNDPYMFGEIITINDAIGEDGKGSQIRTIAGKDVRFIFKRRVIKNLNNEENWAMTAKGEICLRELVKAQCGSGAEEKRQLPISNTIPISENALGNEYSVAEAFSNLYDTLVTIATQSEIGWRIKFDGALTLEVFEGSDLSSKVQFSTDFDSLSNGEFTDSAESYANTIYVGGKGTGADRDIYEGESAIEGSSPTGLDRYEAWDNQSSMTSESEYEAEAFSMLTQYGQTLNINGQGLAKCPYEFQKQYNIGDKITLAFSGKSAKAQILSVTEHWVWGQYGIEFSFGKPQNDLSRQLQLILKQIQKASNKTTTTSSVKYYTIPTDTSQPKADVIYDTIGFEGDCGTGATFQLYYDSEKTGAKTYHVWFKQLAGSGKLTLTTGVSGASNLVLNAGTYVAIIYVDADGNVLSQGATATDSIQSGNTQPATSGGVAQAISTEATDRNTAISNALALPTDAILHYSFDDVPDYPDGSADVSLLNNNTYNIQSTDYKFSNNAGSTFSNNNGNLQVNIAGGAGDYGAYISNTYITNKILKFRLNVTSISGTLKITNGVLPYNVIKDITKIGTYTIEYYHSNTSSYPSLYFLCRESSHSCTFTVEQIYIGDGSYSTPVIDNADGQYNGINYGSIVTQGISGKAIKSFLNTYKPIKADFTIAPPYSYSLWLKCNTNFNITQYIIDGRKSGLSDSDEGFILLVNKGIEFGCESSGGYIATDAGTIVIGQWAHFVITCDVTSSGNSYKAYKNGVLIKEASASVVNQGFRALAVNGRFQDVAYYSKCERELDDFLFFNRILSAEEVQALYLNKANTPKYFPIPTNEIKQDSLELATSGGVFNAINKLNCFIVTFTASLLNQCWGYYVKCGTRVFVRLKFILTSALSDWQSMAPAKTVPTPTSPFSVSADGKTGPVNSIYIYSTGAINQAGGGGMAVGTYEFNFDYETTD